MQYNVAQLLQEPTGATRRYTVDEPAKDVQALFDGDAVTVTSPLQGTLTFMRTTDSILVTGDLRLTVEVVCERCLTRFEVPVAAEVEETFRPTVDIRSGAQLPPVKGEERETLIDEHHILDLSEVVRQMILLAAPMYPVCRPDCAGLCPRCGQNLNEAQCDCTVEVVDPRWSKLKTLLDEQQYQSEP
jgi:uncharacterized protein